MYTCFQESPADVPSNTAAWGRYRWKQFLVEKLLKLDWDVKSLTVSYAKQQKILSALMSNLREKYLDEMARKLLAIVLRDLVWVFLYYFSVTADLNTKQMNFLENTFLQKASKGI